MAGSKTAYGARAILARHLGNAYVTVPYNWHLALSLAGFDPTSTGPVPNEIAGGGYSRAAVSNDSDTFDTVIQAWPALTRLKIDVTFPTATADWGAPAAVYLVDEYGSAWYGCDLIAAQPVLSGQQLTLPAGLLVFRER